MSARPWWKRVLGPAVAVVAVLAMVVVTGSDSVSEWRDARPSPAAIDSNGIAVIDGVAISLDRLEPFDFIDLHGSDTPYIPPDGWTSWVVKFTIHEISSETEIYSVSASIVASDGNTYEESSQLPYNILPEGTRASLPDEPGPYFGAFLLPDGVTPVSARLKPGVPLPEIWSFDYADLG